MLVSLQQFLDSHPAFVSFVATFILTSYFWQSLLGRERKARMEERLEHINERTELIDELIRLKEKEQDQ